MGGDMPTLDAGGWAHFGDEVLGPDQRRDPRIWGTQGNLNDNLGVFDQRRQVDPSIYTEQFVPGGGDSSPDRWSYTLRPEIAAQLGGRTQIGQLGAGGHAELKDPGATQWDDRFGFLTKPENYSNADPRETGFNELMSRAVQIGAIAAPAYFAGPELFAQMFGEAGGGAGAWEGGFGAGGLAPEEAAFGLGDGLGSGSWGAGDLIDSAGESLMDVPGQMARLPPGQFTPMANSPWASPWQQFLDNPLGSLGNRIASNPLGAAQFASGIAGALGGGSDDSGGGSNDIGGTVDPFELNLGDYQPNQVTERQLADYGGFEQSLGGDMWNTSKQGQNPWQSQSPWQSQQGYGQAQGSGYGQAQARPMQQPQGYGQSYGQAQEPQGYGQARPMPMDGFQGTGGGYGQARPMDYSQGMLGGPAAQQDTYGGGMLGSQPIMSKPYGIEQGTSDGFGPRPPPQSTPNPAQPSDEFGPRQPPPPSDGFGPKPPQSQPFGLGFSAQRAPGTGVGGSTGNTPWTQVDTSGMKGNNATSWNMINQLAQQNPELTSSQLMGHQAQLISKLRNKSVDPNQVTFRDTQQSFQRGGY